MANEVAVIVGAGRGLSASLARRLSREGMRVALVARDTGKLEDLVRETGALAIQGDAGDAGSVESVFAEVEGALGAPDLVVFNAGARYRGPIADLEPARVLDTYRIGAFGGFLVAQAAARRMLQRGHGSIFLTGATAAVKSMPQSVPFAMAKFALRALAQGLARELSPENIHVAHFVIDGGIASSVPPPGPGDVPDRWLDPDAIADTYLAIHRQHRSAWTWEIELRPWVETF